MCRARGRLRSRKLGNDRTALPSVIPHDPLDEIEVPTVEDVIFSYPIYSHEKGLLFLTPDRNIELRMQILRQGNSSLVHTASGRMDQDYLTRLQPRSVNQRSVGHTTDQRYRSHNDESYTLRYRLDNRR